IPFATPRATSSMRSGILRRRSAFRVRTVPPRRAVSGMMLKAVPAPISPTVRTAGPTGSTSLETTVCKAVTIWAAIAMASAERCGIAPWPPVPLRVISKGPADAIMGPAFVAAFPNGSPGHRCSAKIEPTSSAAPSSTMTLPPPSPSSAGWKKNLTVPFSLSRIPERACAAPTSMLVCPSWPQACILPSVCEANGSPVSSWIGNASMSALRPTVGPSPSPFKVAMTPFSATPVRMSRGRPSSAASTFSAVRSVSKPSSGSLWISLLRATIFSPSPSRTSSFRPSNLWTTLISFSLPRRLLSLQPPPARAGSRRRLRRPERGLERQAGGVEPREHLDWGRPLPRLREADRARHPREHFRGTFADGRPVCERHSAVALGEAPPIWPQNQRHVRVAGRGQAEQALEQCLARRRIEQVGAPHHLAYVLSGVVHDDGELVGGGAVVATHDEVVYLPFVSSEQEVLEGHAGVLRSHPEGWRTSRGLPLSSFPCHQLAAGSRVAVGGGDPVRRRDRGPDLRPRTVAGVQKTPGVEAGYGLLVERHPPGLAHDGSVPFEPEGPQVG